MNKVSSVLYTKANQFIFGLFYTLLGLAYFFALISPNLRWGDNSVFGTSTTYFLLFFLVALLGLGISIFLFPTFRKALSFFFVQQGKRTAIACLILVIIFQICFIWYFHPAAGWDVGAIHEALLDPTDSEINAYFSLNQNNIPILLLQEKLVSIFGMSSWLFFDYVTLVLVDISAVLTIAAATFLNKKNFVLATYIHALFLSVFPWIVVPYTDTWVLPFVSFMLFAYCWLQKSQSMAVKIVMGSLLAFATVSCYFIKPSALIPFIAMIIMQLIQVLYSNRFKTIFVPKRKWWVAVSILFILFSAFNLFSRKIETQTFIEINKDRGIPMIHFINIGLSDDGAYDPQAALKMAALPTKAEKIAYSKKQIVKRLEEKGLIGYVTFLVEKQKNNTADGTFAWVKEGNFFVNNEKPNNPQGLTGLFENTLFLYGEYIANFRFLAQMVWIFILTLIFFGWSNRSKIVQLLRLSLIGTFLFLLIFEGGRSRYLIQTLPVILLMTTILAPTSWKRIKSIVQQLYYSPDK